MFPELTTAGNNSFYQCFSNCTSLTTITFSKLTDDSGDDTWPTFHIDSLPSGHEYTIKEIEVEKKFAIKIVEIEYNLFWKSSIEINKLYIEYLHLQFDIE